MKNFNNFSLLLLKVFYSYVFACNSLNLYGIMKSSDLYQITLFTSENFSKTSYPKPTFLFFDHPSVTYSFNVDQRILDGNHSQNTLNTMYTLQESLVIFHTSNLSETESFLDFLIPQLSVRKRPKCLIMFSINNSGYSSEINVIDALKYAWKNKFLDFSILKCFEDCKIHSSNLVHYYNPFNDVLYVKELDEDIEIFPDKLQNSHGYPFYFARINYTDYTTRIIRYGRKVNIIIRNDFVVDFTARILNLRTVKKNVNVGYLFPQNYLKEWKLDMVAFRTFNKDYLTYFLIPAVDQRATETIAFVPILPTSRVDLLLKVLYNLSIIIVLVSIFLYLISYFRTAVESIKVFDVVRLLLSQSINAQSNKTVYRIMILTIIIASIKVMNEVLLDIISIQFEKREMPFETYEDLYSSQLQTYTPHRFLKQLENINEPYLSRVLKQTLFDSNSTDCLVTLKIWKNVSCIFIPYDAENVVSDFRDSDGSPTLKVAQPPIQVISNYFYWFSDASPYAMKFLKIMQRMKETSLMHWETLVEKKPNIMTVEENKVTIQDGIKLEQLLTILCFGFSISIIILIIELVTFKAGKIKM